MEKRKKFNGPRRIVGEQLTTALSRQHSRIINIDINRHHVNEIVNALEDEIDQLIKRMRYKGDIGGYDPCELLHEITKFQEEIRDRKNLRNEEDLAFAKPAAVKNQDLDDHLLEHGIDKNTIADFYQFFSKENQ